MNENDEALKWALEKQLMLWPYRFTRKIIYNPGRATTLSNQFRPEFIEINNLIENLLAARRLDKKSSGIKTRGEVSTNERRPD